MKVRILYITIILLLFGASIFLLSSCSNNSGNACLSALILSHGTLDPEFSKDVTSYIAAVENSIDSITVTATADHPHATITINGVSVQSEQASDPISLEPGENTVSILVTAADGTTKTYTIRLERLVTFTKKANMSVDEDRLNGMATDDNYIYLVGYDNLSTNNQWHIQKRFKLTGELVTYFGGDGIVQSNPSGNDDSAYCLAIDTDYMYIAGYDAAPGMPQWHIEKRNIITGVLINTFGTNGVVVSDPTAGPDEPYAIAVDTDYMYIAGYDAASYPDTQWRIEKRDIVTGDLINGFGTNGIIGVHPNNQSAHAYSIATDGNYLYIAGDDSSPGNSQWRIEKRDVVTGALISDFDADGVVQSNLSDSAESARSIAFDNSCIYIAGSDYSSGNSQWRIEKRDIESGALIDDFDSDGILLEDPSISSDTLYVIAVDTFYVYLAGYDYEYGMPNSEWRLEKRYKVTGDF